MKFAVDGTKDNPLRITETDIPLRCGGIWENKRFKKVRFILFRFPQTRKIHSKEVKLLSNGHLSG
jgi:hypothetical protein